MAPIVQWALLIGFAGVMTCVVLLLARHYAVESFEGDKLTTEEQVIDVYHTVLQRSPSAREMVDAVRALDAGEWTVVGLKQRLMDSDEYDRLIKLQSNSLSPELQKMVSDKALIETIARVYKQERRKTIPPHMILPLKDAYIALEYNEHALRVVLRSPKYSYLEVDAKRTVNLDREQFMELIERHIGTPAAITSQAAVLAKEQMSVKIQSRELDRDQQSPSGAHTHDRVHRSIDDVDTDMTHIIDAIKEGQRQRTHHGNMVLRPEMSWSVPQQSPPVCTTQGQKPLTQPVMLNSRLLLGTPLDDSKQTGVGSIMPRFEFVEHPGSGPK